MNSRVKSLPCLVYLEECFEVDFVLGVLVWRERPISHFDTLKGWKIFNTKHKGKVAGSIDVKGYVVVRLTGWGSLKVHKVVYTMYHDEDVPYVDHFNRVRSDNSISNLRPEDHNKNPKNASKYSNNKTGFTGVGYRENVSGTQKRFTSYWKDLKGNDRSKDFSIARHGDDAFKRACEYRLKMIEELNAQGAGYTEDHGK